MNIEERALVKEALQSIGGFGKAGDSIKAIQLLQKALTVRKPLHVCEKCLKIGGCEHVKGSTS